MSRIMPGEWVEVADVRGTVVSVDQQAGEFMFMKHGAVGKETLWCFDVAQARHCAPTPLPSRLPIGTRYQWLDDGKLETFEVTESPEFNGSNRWGGGFDKRLHDGFEGPCSAAPSLVDWESYWLAMRGERLPDQLVDPISMIDEALAELDKLSRMLA